MQNRSSVKALGLGPRLRHQQRPPEHALAAQGVTSLGR
jgi:hypothetical protein